MPPSRVIQKAIQIITNQSILLLIFTIYNIGKNLFTYIYMIGKWIKTLYN